MLYSLAAYLESAAARLANFVRPQTFERPRLLFVDEMLPDPRLGAGFPRAVEIIDALIAADWQIDHYAKASSARHRREMTLRFGGQVRFLPSAGVFGLKRALRVHGRHCDAILVSRPTTMATFLEAQDALGGAGSRPRLIYDAEAIFTEREVVRLALEGRPMSDAKIAAKLSEEMSLTQAADMIMSVTEADATMYRRQTGKSVAIVSHAVAPNVGSNAFHDRTDMVIIGKFEAPRRESPNLDSVLWFLEEVLPIIRRADAALPPLKIVGWVSDEARKMLADHQVVFAGIVDDLASSYNSARIMIAPTRFSAGLPLKVLEAAAAGVPCVVTDRVARQAGWVNNVHALAGDDAETFAAACLALYSDADRWEAVRRAALADVSERFSSASLRSAVGKVMQEVCSLPATIPHAVIDLATMRRDRDGLSSLVTARTDQPRAA